MFCIAFGKILKVLRFFYCMDKSLIEAEIERQEQKLTEILRGGMREPERSNNISRITRTILWLKKLLEK